MQPIRFKAFANTVAQCCGTSDVLGSGRRKTDQVRSFHLRNDAEAKLEALQPVTAEGYLRPVAMPKRRTLLYPWENKQGHLEI